jgi:V/A-type H+-transporting ATPase subunit I
LIDVPGLGIPALALFFSSSLERAVEGLHGHPKTGKKKEKEGAIGLAVGGLVELIESFSYYLSNTMSFLRVGAFALSHAVLSFVVFTMGELLRTRAPVGILWEILVFVIGNIVIIVLEGLIVTIQVVRLQYYEFFSKFFTDTGKEFLPFGFGKTRSGS